MSREEQKALKEMRYILKNYQKEELDIGINTIRTVLSLINKLQKENEELKFFGESYRKQIKLMQNEYKTGNFIHKGFIKDKIEELETKINVIPPDNKYTYREVIEMGIDVLQELLDKE